MNMQMYIGKDPVSVVTRTRNLFNINLISDYIEQQGDYFTFIKNPHPPRLTVTFSDKPINVYAKWKYKVWDSSVATNVRGVVAVFQDADGNTVKELSSYVRRTGELTIYAENVVSVRFTYGNKWKNTLGEFMISEEDVPYEPYIQPYDTYIKHNYIPNIDTFLFKNLVKNEDGSYTFTRDEVGGGNRFTPFTYPDCMPAGKYCTKIDIVEDTTTHVIPLSIRFYDHDNNAFYANFARNNRVLTFTAPRAVQRFHLYIQGGNNIGDYITFKSLELYKLAQEV